MSPYGALRLAEDKGKRKKKVKERKSEREKEKERAWKKGNLRHIVVSVVFMKLLRSCCHTHTQNSLFLLSSFRVLFLFCAVFVRNVRSRDCLNAFSGGSGDFRMCGQNGQRSVCIE